ncbi:MAG: hypothetical protein QG608_598 [Actinomycetota bacterium]|nr:hypothetical protein [Actinomycetota bacterium]
MDLIASWSTALAQEVSVLEVPLAADIGHRFARGGKERRALLNRAGEDSGGFGGALGPGELASVLQALADGGRVVLDLLDRQAIGNTASVTALLVTALQARRGNPHGGSEGSGLSPSPSPSASPTILLAFPGERTSGAEENPLPTKALPADLCRALDSTVAELTRLLSAPGRSTPHAQDLAVRVLVVLAGDPENAALFLREIEPSLGPAGAVSPASSEQDGSVPDGFAGPVALPPWSWLYLLGLTFAVPGWVGNLTDRYEGYDYLSRVTHFPDQVKLLVVPWAMPMVFLIVGALTVALPGVRRRWVERQYHLSIRPEGDARAIQDFVDQYASGVEVVLSGDGGRYARIYPVGPRRARLGVFAPFLQLWKQDRAAAQAVLLHELAHRRQGEHLLLGLGSPLQAMLRVWGTLFLCFVLLPFVLLVMADDPLSHPLSTQVIIDATGPLRILLLPVGAIWCAEIAADRWAARLHGAGAVLAALEPVRRGPLWRRALSCLDHPPLRLRRALLTGRAPSILLLAVWPLVPVVQLALIVAGAVPAWYLLGYSNGKVADLTVENSHDYLVEALWVTAGGVGMLVLWALRTARARRSGQPGQQGSNGGPGRYLVASLFPLALVAVAGLPGEDGGEQWAVSTPTPSTSILALPLVSPDPEPTPTPSASPSPSVTRPTPTPSASPSPSVKVPASPDPTPSPSDDGPRDSGGDGSGSEVAGQSLPATYEVTLSGTTGGRDFERPAQLRVLPTITRVGITNDLNAVDVCLVSGEPAGRPEVGAIQYGSNSNCRPGNNGAAMDMGYVKVNGSTITVSPDERIAATLSNSFSTSNDYIYAGLYAPVDGSLRIDLGADGSLSGTVKLQGYGGAGYGNTVYRAQISGARS